MDLAAIRDTLDREPADHLMVQSFEIRTRKLVVALLFGGGPREDQALLLCFRDAIVFHLPCVLWEPVQLVKVPPEQAGLYIPEVSYDPEERIGQLVAFTALDGTPFGHYVACEQVTGEWHRLDENSNVIGW